MSAGFERPVPGWALHDATEWQGFRGHAEALARPESVEEVAEVLARCAAGGVPVAVRGGGTGLAGGCVPDGGVVLSLERLASVRSVVPEERRMVVEAGVTTARVARVARENGLHFGVDPGAAEQSHVGGNVATNAGGPHTHGSGPMRDWVAGLEVVLASGAVVRTASDAPRDVAGYDLTALICGSEGTLGVITAVDLRLAPAAAAAPVWTATFADAAAGAAAALEVTGAAVLDFLDGGALAATGRGGAGFLLIGEGGDMPGGAVVADDPAAVWRWRSGVSHAVAAAHGGKLSEDVAVPRARLAEMVDGVVAIGARHGLEACSWGHAGDGIVHATFLAAPAEAARALPAAEEVFDLALSLGGSLSGEHGLGRLKAHRAAAALGPGRVAALRAIKAALDPAGILNPGVKLPPA